jgi:hypothetical protein
MLSSLDEFLIGIVIGIRFRANFSIEDQLGRMVDTILYSKGAFFDPTIFPQVNSGIVGKVLFNERTQDNLKIDNSNIILEVFFGQGNRFKLSDLSLLHEQFDNKIVHGVMDSFSITQIVRIGYVKRYLFKIDDLARTFVDKTIGRTLGGVNDINLSFSKKLAVPDALVKRDVNDHQNAIFNIIKKADTDEIFMSVDFQHLYDPFLQNSSEIEFKSFIEQNDSFNSRNYLSWLNSNYMEK